jgi:Thiol-disulfide isomerase and thioredoxins
VKHPFRWIALGVGVAVALLAVILAVNVGTDPRADFNTSRLLGKPAPNFELTRFDGSKVTLAGLAGKTVIVNFWNSWCLPCRDELPALQAWYAAHQSDDSVVMVGIPRDDFASDIREAARRDHMGWAVANDRGAQAATLAYATRGQPESFVISPSGIVVGSIIGPMRTQDLDRMARVGQGV